MKAQTMQRREAIAFLSGAAVMTVPRAAHAQQRPTTPVIGLLHTGSPAGFGLSWEAFRRGLSDAGHVEGRNLTIEYRWGEGQLDRLPALAADLVRQRVNLIFALGPPAIRAANAATTIIPIVFIMGEDPVKEGLVASLNRPGGNATGFTNFSNVLTAKRLGLLREAVPSAQVLGLLIDPTNPNADPDTKEVQAAAAVLGRTLHVFNASNEREIEAAFAAMVERGVEALQVNVNPFFVDRREQVAALAGRRRIPVMYDRRDFPVAGGLMS